MSDLDQFPSLGHGVGSWESLDGAMASDHVTHGVSHTGSLCQLGFPRFLPISIARPLQSDPRKSMILCGVVAT